MGCDKWPLISVIIPIYGVEKYIAECLESVIAQTYKNLEIIIINDGTKDASADIAKEYAKKDARIKVYDFENGGLSVARNRGLKLAKGEYIAFLDSDDSIEVDTYRYCIECMQKNDLDMVKYGLREFCVESNEEKNYVYENKIYSKPNIADKYFTNFLNVVVWNAVYSRNLALSVEYPANVVNEDNYASGMYFALSNKMMTIDKVFHNYRVNFTGISKGMVKRPLDKCIATRKLCVDIEKIGDIIIEKYYWRYSCELYHFIRGWNNLYKVKSIDKELYVFAMRYLDLRRKVLLYLFVKKKQIKIV